jgi:hypothetical protein
MKDLARPSLLLAEINQRYPGIWRLFDARRIARKETGPNWCFMPISEVIACLPVDIDDERAQVKTTFRGAYFAALYAWRMTQGIYQIDLDVMEALAGMPLDGDIPDEVLYHLPEWCIYIDFARTNAEEIEGEKIHSIFAHMEYDTETKEPELRFLADTDTRIAPIPVHLGCGSLAASIERARAVAVNNAQRLGIGSTLDDKEEYWQTLYQALTTWLNFTLYLTSTNADYKGPRPARSEPKPIKTKKGPRYFPPDQPRIWDVGLREGAALRTTKAKLSSGSSESTGSRAPMRPHWHLYRVGPGRSSQTLKWIAPVLVGGGTPEDRPAVIRHL